MSGTDKTMRVLLLAMFASSIPATLILPMLPRLGQHFDIGSAELGMLVGIYPLTSMLASPFWGRMSDRFGRKPVLVITLLAGAGAFLCFAASTSWLGLFAGRALQGLAGTPRGIGFAVASDLSDREERTAGIGAVTAAMAVGFTAGPLLGGLLMGENPDSLLGQLRALIGLEAGGFSHVLPSLFGVALNAGAALVLLLGFTETLRPDESGSEASDKQDNSVPFRQAILQSAVLVAVLFFLLSGFIQGSLQFSFALWADLQHQWNAQQIAWAMTAIGLGFAFGSGFLLRPLVHRFGQQRTVLMGTLVDASGLLVFLLMQHSLAGALGGLFLSAMGGALWGTTILSLLSQEISARDQGLAMGLANAATLLGRVAGPILAGYLATELSPGAPFVFMLCCVLVAAGRGLLLVRR